MTINQDFIDQPLTSGTSVVFLVGLTVGTNVDLVYPT
jgi:hypothetical protein